MAEHDYVIANDTAPQVRDDVNDALAAIVSNNSKATEPTTMFAYQWWYDTSTNTLKQRNSANDAWITILTLDQTNDLLNYADIIPTADNTDDIGSSTKAFKDIYMQGNFYFDNDNSRTQKHYTWVPINKDTASASATIDKAITGYDSYRIEFKNVLPATDGVFFRFRVSNDAGVSFKAGSAYGFALRDGGSSAGNYDAQASSTISLMNEGTGFQQGNAATEGLFGYIEIYGAGVAGAYTKINWFFTYGYTDGNVVYCIGTGVDKTAEVIDAVQVYYSSGNLASGDIVLKGQNFI